MSNHNNLRTNEVIGELVNGFPPIGEPIFLVSEPLNKDFIQRQILTTPVIKILDNQYFTKNSVYKIEVL